MPIAPGEAGSSANISGTVAVYFDPANPSVNATFTAASLQVVPTDGSRVLFDSGYQAQRVLIVGSQSNASLQVSGITSSINAYLGATAGTLQVKLDPSSVVQISNTPTVTANAGSGTMTVAFDPGHELGSIKGITNSINVYLGATAGTVNIALKPGTIAVSLDPGYTVGKVDQGNATSSGLQAWLTNSQNTASIFTVSGSTSGISVSGVNLVAPSASYNFKVFAYSLQTTGLVSLTAKFVNGSGASQTEFWRPLVSSAVTASQPQGSNMMVPPPSFLFATGTNTSLNLLLDTASLVHYSVSYIKESA